MQYMSYYIRNTSVLLYVIHVQCMCHCMSHLGEAECMTQYVTSESVTACDTDAHDAQHV